MMWCICGCRVLHVLTVGPLFTFNVRMSEIFMRASVCQLVVGVAHV